MRSIIDVILKREGPNRTSTPMRPEKGFEAIEDPIFIQSQFKFLDPF